MQRLPFGTWVIRENDSKGNEEGERVLRLSLFLLLPLSLSSSFSSLVRSKLIQSRILPSMTLGAQERAPLDPHDSLMPVKERGAVHSGGGVCVGGGAWHLFIARL